MKTSHREQNVRGESRKCPAPHTAPAARAPLPAAGRLLQYTLRYQHSKAVSSRVAAATNVTYVRRTVAPTYPTHTRCILHICQTCHRASASSAEPPTDIDAKPAADAAESGAEAEVAAVRVQVEAAVDAAPERPQPREDLACLVGLALGLGLGASSWCFGGHSSAIQQYTPVCRR